VLWHKDGRFGARACFSNGSILLSGWLSVLKVFLNYRPGIITGFQTNIEQPEQAHFI